MSALNVTQDEADLLLTGLKMFADVQRNSGSVSDDVVALMAKLAPAPVAPVAVVEEVAAPVVEEVVKKSSAQKVVEETPVEEAPEAE